jgi:hypothetical protein
MRTEAAFAVLRTANPVPATFADDRELFARITAESGDQRLSSAARRSWRRHLRRGWVVAAATLITACGAAGAALVINKSALRRLPRNADVLTSASPREIFRLDYQSPYVWRQPGVLLNTVREVTAVSVPGFGTLHYWIADSRKHWLCGAMRLPDGSWVGAFNKYDIGGAVPGCSAPGPSTALFGWAILGTTIYVHHIHAWNLVYGRVSPAGHPVEVRDELSGRTARIVAGRYFAIALPARSCHLPWSCNYERGSRLVTVNAHDRKIESALWGP